jgi:hypothetical protein
MVYLGANHSWACVKTIGSDGVPRPTRDGKHTFFLAEESREEEGQE